MLFFYKTAVNICWIYIKIFFSLTISGHEELPSKTGYILTANHLSYFDPFLIAKYTKRPVRFLALKRFFGNFISNFLMRRWLAIPIDTQSIDRHTLETAIKYLQQDAIIGIFPEGKISKNGQQSELQTGAAMLAMHSHKPIVPVTIEGTRNLYRPSIFTRKKICVTFKSAINTQDVMRNSKGNGTKAIRNQLIQLIEDRLFS